MQRLRQRGHVQALADELVGQDGAQRARNGDDGHALAGAALAVARQMRQLRHLRKVVALDDVELLESRLVDLLVTGEGRGV